MSPILIYDTELHFPDFTVVSASAGSGKTHTLTLRLLQLLLSDRIPKNRLNNILAMTFTRNAAAEMRQRILEYLKKAYHGDTEIMPQLSVRLSIDEEKLRARCGELIETILKDYSAFQVQTIDSFMAHIFRSSAFEFGFSPAFEIETEDRRLLNEAFEQFACELATDPSKRAWLEELTDVLAEIRQTSSKYPWNPYRILSEEIQKLYGKLNAQDKEVILPPAEKQSLTTRRNEILEKVNRLGELVKESGLSVTKYFEMAMEAAMAHNVDDLIERKSLYKPPFKTSGSQKVKQQAEEWNIRFAPLQEEIRSLASSYTIYKVNNYYSPLVEAYNTLRSTIELTMRRSGRISLADINRKLISYISEETVPQIYFYIGDSIYHYLIDEFQDTSPVQWATIKPLLSEALSKQGSLFLVGDTKQSIYSFRYADWRIMKNVMEKNVFPSAPPDVQELKINYRSYEAIVDFSKKVFHDIVPQAMEGKAPHASGLSTFTQDVKKDFKGKGYVEVVSFEKDEALEPERDKILKIVKDCIKRGYNYKDIMIITPQNEHVIAVSGWLNTAQLRFISHSSLDIRVQSVTGEILALLRFFDSPVDDLSFATFLLGNIFRHVLEADGSDLSTGELGDFILRAKESYGSPPLYTAFRKKYPAVWKKYFDELFTLVGYLPMYDFVSEMYKLFGLFKLLPDDEATLAKLLEVIMNFEETGQNTLKDFLEYSEDDGSDDDWNIVVPPGEDAVSVMTIHKAKGLDKRVVIVLLVDSRPHPDNLFLKKDEDGIRLLRITKNEKEFDASLDEIYMNHQTDRKVDDLNKLYVALTRAKEEMYIISVTKTSFDEPSKFLPQTGYEPSKKPKVEKKKDPAGPSADLHHSILRVPLKISPPEKLATYERLRGELIHEVLSKVKFLDIEIDSFISTAIQEISGNWPEVVNKSEIKGQLLDFLRLPAIQPYFNRTEGKAVLNEQEFVTPHGHLLRMDRVVIDKDRITVVDFKTGEDNADYDTQVSEYMSVLRDFYPGKIVDGVLVFVDLKKIRVVA